MLPPLWPPRVADRLFGDTAARWTVTILFASLAGVSWIRGLRKP